MIFAPERDDPGRDSLEQYLADISHYPLVDREEEVRLARAARSGDAEALEKLVRSNLRFVVSVAKRYQNQGVPLGDLINEGNLGLIRAARRFDETRGIKFISYAVWWIRQAILQALADQSRVVRVPLNQAGVLHRTVRRHATLLQELGREPTTDELAEDLGVSEEEVGRALALSRNQVSLDAPVWPDDEEGMVDRLPTGGTEDGTARLEEESVRSTVRRALETLTHREGKVLTLYFGLDEQEPMTLQEIGSLLGVTRERARQIKERALRRLRHQSRARFIGELAEGVADPPPDPSSDGAGRGPG